MAAVFAHPSLIAITVFYSYLAWQHGRPLKETLYRTLPQFLTAIAAIAFLLFAYSNTPQIRAIVRTPGPIDLLQNLFWFWGRQLTTAHWLPKSLQLDRSEAWELGVGALFIASSVLLSLRQKGPVRLWTIWALLLTLPFLTANLGDNASGPSRYLYIASAGTTLILTAGLNSLSQWIPARIRPFFMPVLLILLVASSWRSLKEAEAISFYQSGRSYIAQGDIETGALQFENAVARHPLRVPADGYFRLAAASFAGGISPESFLLKVRSHIPDKRHLDILLHLCAYLKENPENWDRAEQNVRNILNTGDASLLEETARAYFNLGSYYQRSDKLDRAVDLYTRTLRLLPDYPIALKNLGAALHSQGKLRPAIDAFEKALALQPGDPELATLLSGDTVTIETRLADLLYQQGKTEAAIRAYREMIERRPNEVPILQKLAHIYYN